MSGCRGWHPPGKCASAIMTDDPAAPDLALLLLTVPHPATRRAAAFLERIFAASGRRIAFSLATTADHRREADVPALYLCPGVTDALDLAVTADLHGQPALRTACALLADLDERWRGVPRLSLECVVDRPHEAVRCISRQLGLAPAEAVLAAADALLPALRDDVVPFLHVLPFLAATEPSEPGIAWMDEGMSALDVLEDVLAMVSADVPRHMLVVTRSGAVPVTGLVERATGWRQDHVELGDPALGLPAAEGALGLVCFDRVHGMLLGDMLDRVMDRLAPGGLLCGEERTDTAAEAAVAQLTKAGDRHHLVFALSGNTWRAIAPAWWR